MHPSLNQYLKQVRFVLGLKVLLLLCAFSVDAQVLVPKHGHDSIKVCGGTLKDRDSLQQVYEGGRDGSITLYPLAKGTRIKLTFTNFHLNEDDYIEIYNGPSVNSPLLGRFYILSSLKIIESTDTSGALTILFKTFYNGYAWGFSSFIECLVPTVEKDVYTKLISTYSHPSYIQNRLEYNSFLRGNAPEPLMINKAYFSNDEFLDQQDSLYSPGFQFTQLPNTTNQFSTQNYILTLEPGEHFSLVKTDANNVLAEQDESNNLLAIPFDVDSFYVDLLPSKIYNNSIELRQNRLEYINTGVLNLGTLKSSNFTCHLYFSADSLLDAHDSLIATKSFNEIYPSVNEQSMQMGFQLDSLFPLGDHFLILLVDADSLVTERNQSNNLLVYPIRLLSSSSDLFFLYGGIVHGDIAPGGIVSTFQSIRSIGNYYSNVSVGGYLSVDSMFDQSDIILSSFNYPFYVGGDYKHYSIPPNSVPGDYFLILVLDTGNTITEINENNNILILPLRIVATRFDLKFEERVWNQTNNLTGIKNHLSIRQGFFTKVYVYNNGNLISPSCDIGYYLSTDSHLDSLDKIILIIPQGALYPEQKSNPEIALGWGIPSWLSNGKYYIITKIDTYNSYPEVDELNNLIVDSIYIDSNQYDYFAENRELYQKDIFKSTDTINYISPFNSNYLPANGIYDLFALTKTYITSKKEIDTTAIPITTFNAAPPSVSYLHVVLPGNLQDGIYYIASRIDEQDSLHELNEYNNTSFIPFSITNGVVQYDSIRANKHDTIYTCYSTIKCTQVPNGELTLIPTIPGKKLAMYMSEIYNQGSSIDIYDGMDSTANLIFTLDELEKPASTIYANNPSGALTLKSKIKQPWWVSSSFHATAACVDSLPLPDLCFSMNANYAATTKVTDNFEKFNLNFEVANLGGAKVNSSNLTVFLSTDEVIDNLDVPLDTIELIQLYGGIQKKLESSFYLPGNLAPNEYYLIAKIDHSNLCIEQSETNNTYIIRILIQNAKPEFYIRKTYFDTYSLANNPYSIHGSTSIINSAGYYSDSISVGLYLSNDSLFDASDTLLQLDKRKDRSLDFKNYVPSINYNIDLPQQINAGNYYLLLVVDPENKAIESDESNNMQVIPLRLVPRTVDIDLLDFTLQFPYINGKRNISLSPLTYINRGNYQQDSLFKVATYLSVDSILDAADVLLDSNFVPSLGYSYRTIPNESYIGNFYLICYADFNQQLNEINENNNIIFKKVELPDTLVEIEAKSIACTSRMIRAGNFINIHYSYNYSSGDIQKPVNAVVCLSSDTLFDASDIRLDSIYANMYFLGLQLISRSYVYLPISIASGHYYLLVAYDAGNLLPEQNENNNFCWTNLYVLPNRTDLCFEHASLGSSQAVSNEFVVANTTVYNHSNVTMDSSYVHYYLSTDTLLDSGDSILAQSYSERILPGSYSYKNTFLALPYLPLAGDYYILCKVDATNALQENNEMNNVKALPLHIDQPFQDLGLEAPDISNHWLAAGDSVDLTVHVRNLGNTTSLGSAITIFLSKDLIIDSQDALLKVNPINELAAGASILSTFQLNLPTQIDTGNYYFIYSIDQSNLIAESNEQNNSTYLPFNVGVVGIPQTAYQLSALQVAPNPFHNKLKLSFSSADLKSIKIYDLIGQLIYSEPLTRNQQFEIDTHDWESGSYLLEIKEKELIFRRKLIKTN